MSRHATTRRRLPHWKKDGAIYWITFRLADAVYVLGTFPIVRREDKAAFGHYRTRNLILAYMNALAAGDTETDVVV